MRTARRRTQERRRVDTNRESSVYPTVSSQEKERNRYGAGRVVPGKPSRGTDTDRVVVRRMRPDIQQFKLSVRATAARVCRPPASRLSRLPPGASAPGSGDQNTCSRRCRRGERRA